jgi:hypothetical protein
MTVEADVNGRSSVEVCGGRIVLEEKEVLLQERLWFRGGGSARRWF